MFVFRLLLLLFVFVEFVFVEFVFARAYVNVSYLLVLSTKTKRHGFLCNNKC